MDLLTIGEFGRLARLSPKALRLYGELGLLPPAHVDPWTGHRWYAPDQLDRARLIALLRRVDMPLARIARVIGLDAAAAADELTAYWTDIEAATAARRDLVGYLVDRLTGKRTPMFEIDIREIPARSLLTVHRHVSAQEITAFTTGLVMRLGYNAPALEGVAGAPFLIYYGEVSDDSDGPVEWCRPVPEADADATAARFPDLTLRTEPAHREAYVRLTRTQMDAAHGLLAVETLDRWGAEQGERLAGAPRTVFFADARAAAPDDPVCDVAVPLR